MERDDFLSKSENYLNLLSVYVSHLRDDFRNELQHRNLLTILLTQYQNEYNSISLIYEKIKRVVDEQNPSTSQQNEHQKLTTSNPNTVAQANPDVSYNIEMLKCKYKIELKLEHEKRFSDVLTAVKYNPIFDIVAVGGQSSVTFFSSKGEECNKPEVQLARGVISKPRMLSFSKDGAIIAISNDNHQVILYSLAEGKILTTIDSVTAFVFLDDNKFVCAGERKITSWDPVKCSKLNEKDIPDCQNIVSVAEFYKDDVSYICISDNGRYIRIYDSAMQREFVKKEAQDSLFYCTSTPISGTICTYLHDESVKMWDFNGHDLVLSKVFNGHTDRVLSAVFAPRSDIPLMLTGSKDETVRGWDYKTGEELFVISMIGGNTVFDLDFIPNRDTFVLCKGDGTVSYWNCYIS